MIFLSAYGREETIAIAFDQGAVDYVVKSFSPTELVARMESALHRREAVEPLVPFVLGDLTINYPGCWASIAGRQLQLTTMKYRLLAELAVNAAGC